MDPAANVKELCAGQPQRRLEDSVLVFGYLPPFKDAIAGPSGYV